jgi:hypothetical protein
LLSLDLSRKLAASFRQSYLEASLAAFGVSAHEQKNQPTGGSDNDDRHLNILVNSAAWSQSEGLIRSFTFVRRF